MKKSRLLTTALAAAACAAAHALPVGEKTPLWPEGRMPDAQDHQIAATTAEAKAPGFVREKNRMPHLQWYPAPNAAAKTDACMIIISGGGYNCCCDLPAFEQLVAKLLENGVQCVNLTYSAPCASSVPRPRSADTAPRRSA